jgi:hypothetical protein
VHPDRDAVVGLGGDAEQLDHVPEPTGHLDVGGGDLLDALAEDVGGVDGRVEGERGDDRGLGGGVVAADVRGRVGLGVPELLGLGEHVRVRRPLLGHAGEDVVGGAVQDPDDARDAVPRERLLERLDDRDGTRHRRLEGEVDAGAARQLGELRPLVRDQLLVGRDHRLAELQGPPHQRRGEAATPHDLDDQVDVVGLDHRHRIVGVDLGRQGQVADLGEVADGHPGDLQPSAGAGGQVLGAAVEDGGDAAADGAAAEQADADDTVHG